MERISTLWFMQMLLYHHNIFIYFKLLNFGSKFFKPFWLTFKIYFSNLYIFASKASKSLDWTYWKEHMQESFIIQRISPKYENFEKQFKIKHGVLKSYTPQKLIIWTARILPLGMLFEGAPYMHEYARYNRGERVCSIKSGR